MRTLLIIMIALAMFASQGCSDRKAAGPSPDDSVKMAKNNQASSDGNKSPATPGMDEERKKRQQERDSKKGSEEESSEKEDEKEDSSDDADETSDSERDRAEKRAERDPPPAKRGRGRFNRRSRPATPSMAGGNMAEMKKKREEEEQAKRDRQANSDDDQNTRNRPPTRDAAPPREEVKVASFYDRAMKSFAMKHDPEGFQYLYAHYLTDDSAFDSHPPAWFDGIREPRVGLRWGVAIKYTPGKFDGDPPKIGDSAPDSDSSNNRNRRNGSGSDFGGAGGGGGGTGSGSMGISGGRSQRNRATRRRTGQNQNQNSNRNRGGDSRTSGMGPTESLVYYTGDFGEKLVGRYEMRRQRDGGFYGSIMNSIETRLREETQESNAGTNNQSSRQRRPSGGGDDFGSLGGNSRDLDRTRRERSQRGPDGRGGGGADYEAEETALAPGIMYLGEGNQSDMIARAAANNIDVLVMFTVKVTHIERRNGDNTTKTHTKAQVYSVKAALEGSKEAMMAETRSLSHLAVASGRDKGKTPVEDELDKLFKDMADTKLKAKEIPSSFTADAIRKRYEFLLKKEYTNPLPVLVEIKHYVSKGLLTDNDYMAACESLLGDVEAQDLIDGNMMKKENALKRFLPGEYEVKTASDTNFR